MRKAQKMTIGSPRKVGAAITTVVAATVIALASPVAASAATTFYAHEYSTLAKCVERQNFSSAMGNQIIPCFQNPLNLKWRYMSTNKNY